jgi:hypothetical protein
MKLKITKRGIYLPIGKNGKDQEVEIGKVIDVPTDTIPPALLNKCEPVFDTEGLTLETGIGGIEDNTATVMAELKLDLEKLGVEYPEDATLAELLNIHVNAQAPEKVPSIEELAARYKDLGGKKSSKGWGLPAYTKAIQELEKNGGGDNF